MPWKTWAFLEQVSSAQFQDYLQNQTVNRFTTAAQRDTQILTPVAGMTCVLTTTGEVLTYYGPTVGWRPPWNLPWGTLGHAVNTNTQAGIVTTTDLALLSVTFTALPGRRYESRLCGGIYSSVGGDMCGCHITDQSNNQKCAAYIYSVTNAVSTHIEASCIETSLSGTITRKARASRGQGTGTISWHGLATDPSYFIVQDIGPAAGAVPTILREVLDDEEDLELLPAPETPETKD